MRTLVLTVLLAVACPWPISALGRTGDVKVPAAGPRTVQKGKRADLLPPGASPLQDVANARRIAGVMAHGRWIPRATLARMPGEMAAMQAQ